MKKKPDSITHKIRRESAKIQRGETSGERKDLSNNVTSVSKNALDVLTLNPIEFSPGDNIVKTYTQKHCSFQNYVYRYSQYLKSDSWSLDYGFKERPENLKLLVAIETEFTIKYYLVTSLDVWNAIASKAMHYAATWAGKKEMILWAYIIDDTLKEKSWNFYTVQEKKKWYKDNYNVDVSPWSLVRVTYNDNEIQEWMVDKNLDRLDYKYKSPSGNIIDGSKVLHNPWIILNIKLV